VDQDVTKLIAALAEAVKKLKDVAGLPAANQSSANYDDVRSPDFDNKNERSIKKKGPSLSTNEASRWGTISKIFARTMFNFSKEKNPDFGAKKTRNIPSVINVDIPKSDDACSKSLLKGLGGILLVLGGLGLAIAAFFTGPGAAGKLMQMFSGGLVKLGGIFLESIKKRLGRLVTSAINILKTATFGIIDKVTKAFPKAGKFLKIFSTLGSKLGGHISKVIRFLPGVGALVAFWFAYKNIKAGDIIGGVGEIASGLLSLGTLIPGVGAITGPLGIALDIALLGRYAVMSPSARVKQSEKFGSMFSKLAGWVGDKISKYGKYIPVISSLMWWFESWKAFNRGDIKSGFENIIKGIFPYAPLLAEGVSKGYSIISSLSMSKITDSVNFSNIKDFGMSAKNWISNKLKNLPYFLAKPLEWLGLIEKTDNGKSLELTQGTNEFISKIKAFFSPLSSAGEKIKNYTNNIIDKIKLPGRAIFDTVSQNIRIFIDNIKTASADVFSNAKSKLKGLDAIVKAKVTNVIASGSDLLSDAAARIKNSSTFIANQLKLGKDILVNSSTTVANWQKNMTSSITNFIASKAMSLITSIPKMLKASIGHAKDIIAKIIAVPRETGAAIAGHIAEAGADFGSKIQTNVDKVKFNIEGDFKVIADLNRASVKELSKLRKDIITASNNQVQILKDIRSGLSNIASVNNSAGSTAPMMFGGGGNSSGTGGGGGYPADTNDMFFNDRVSKGIS